MSVGVSYFDCHHCNGTGIDDAGWIRKTAAVRDALAFLLGSRGLDVQAFDGGPALLAHLRDDAGVVPELQARVEQFAQQLHARCSWQRQCSRRRRAGRGTDRGTAALR